MDYAKYITAANTKKDSWDTKISELKAEAEIEAEAEEIASTSNKPSKSTDTKSAGISTGSTNSLSDDDSTLDTGILDDVKLRNQDPIEGFYKDILGRDSDPEGKKYWQQKFDEGMSLTDIQEQFLRSDEYKNKPKD